MEDWVGLRTGLDELSMLFKEIINVYAVNHTKTINTLYGQMQELLTVEAGAAYRCHWGLKFSI
jgi:hypothetical protein